MSPGEACFLIGRDRLKKYNKCVSYIACWPRSATEKIGVGGSGVLQEMVAACCMKESDKVALSWSIVTAPAVYIPPCLPLEVQRLEAGPTQSA